MIFKITAWHISFTWRDLGLLVTFSEFEVGQGMETEKQERNVLKVDDIQFMIL